MSHLPDEHQELIRLLQSDRGLLTRVTDVVREQQRAEEEKLNMLAVGALLDASLRDKALLQYGHVEALRSVSTFLLTVTSSSPVEE